MGEWLRCRKQQYDSQGRSSRIPTEPPPTSPEHQEGEIPLHLTPDFIAASKTAWENAFLGTVDTEIVVWVIRDPVSARIRYDIQKSTNERLKATSTRPDGAIAQIHTHPNIGLPPGTLGDLDKNKPDIFGVPIYILSNKGSYVWGVGSNAPQPVQLGMAQTAEMNGPEVIMSRLSLSPTPANRHDGWRAIGAVGQTTKEPSNDDLSFVGQYRLSTLDTFMPMTSWGSSRLPQLQGGEPRWCRTVLIRMADPAPYSPGRYSATVVAPVGRSLQRQLLELHIKDRKAPFESLLPLIAVQRIVVDSTTCPAVRQRMDALSSVSIRVQDKTACSVTRSCTGWCSCGPMAKWT